MAYKESYSKNIFTPKNILIYLVVGGLVYAVIYYAFLSKNSGYNMGSTPTQQSAPAY